MPRNPNRVQSAEVAVPRRPEPKPVDVVRRRRRSEPRPLPVAEPEFHSTYRYYCRVLEGAYYTVLCRNGIPTGESGERYATPTAAKERTKELNMSLGYPEHLA